MLYIAVYLLVINLVGAALTWLDKERAIRHEWRIPEKQFMTLAVVGAGPGIYVGCRTFRHKTRRAKFMVGIPVIVAVQVLAFALICAFAPEWLQWFQWDAG